MSVRQNAVLCAAVAAVSALVPSAARADNPSFVAINAPAGTPGNRNYFPLGIDFTVNATITITITALGIFDDGSDGIAATGTDAYAVTGPTTLTAVLRQVDRSAVPDGGVPTGTILAEQAFTPAASGTLASDRASASSRCLRRSRSRPATPTTSPVTASTTTIRSTTPARASRRAAAAAQ